MGLALHDARGLLSRLESAASRAGSQSCCLSCTARALLPAAHLVKVNWAKCAGIVHKDIDSPRAVLEDVLRKLLNLLLICQIAAEHPCILGPMLLASLCDLGISQSITLYMLAAIRQEPRLSMPRQPTEA